MAQLAINMLARPGAQAIADRAGMEASPGLTALAPVVVSVTFPLLAP